MRLGVTVCSILIEFTRIAFVPTFLAFAAEVSFLNTIKDFWTLGTEFLQFGKRRFLIKDVRTFGTELLQLR